MKIITRIFEKALDLIFPRSCLGCNTEGGFLCSDCEASLQNLKAPAPLQTEFLDQVHISCEYAGDNLVGKLIKRVKYKFSEEMADILAKTVVRNPHVVEDLQGVIIPVPLSNARIKWRGFNQSELIGKKVASELFDLGHAISFDAKYLKKIRDTKQQAECKSKAERLDNLSGAFQIDKKRSIPEFVILFDDVYTTGTTLNECAKTLRRSGVKKVVGLVIAKKV